MEYRFFQNTQIENYVKLRHASTAYTHAKMEKKVKNPRFSYDFSFFEYFISSIKNPDSKLLRNFCKTEIYDNLTRKKKRKKQFSIC